MWSPKAKSLSCIRYKARILIRGPNIIQTLIKSQDWTADFEKVFDVILEEVVNANLKPDKMVKKVHALTTYKHFLTGSNFNFWGETKMSPFLLLVSATTFTSPKLSFFL
ncbi:hypothetical protein COP2_037264 [Malus domestica]